MQYVFEMIFVALVVFVPAGFANMAPVFANKMKFLKPLGVPLDGGKSFRGKRIFGQNKTVRGFIAGFFFALAGVALQRSIDSYSCVACSGYVTPLSAVNPFVLAALFALGALGGDAIESFFKRQVGKPSGSVWFPFDQLDYIIGGVLATWPVLHYSAETIAWIVVVWFGTHLISTFVGYIFGLKEKPI